MVVKVQDYQSLMCVSSLLNRLSQAEEARMRLLPILIQLLIEVVAAIMATIVSLGFFLRRAG